MEDEKPTSNFNEKAYFWIESHPLLMLLLILTVGIVGVIAYWVFWPYQAPVGTGFVYYDADMDRMLHRTLWDWLGLLIVPAALAAGAIWLNRSQKETELKIAEKARAVEREIADSRQKQATLEAYYDRMTELLLIRETGGSGKLAVSLSIARAHTVAVVKSLDCERNQQLFAFLQASNLIGKDSPIDLLNDANFSKAQLRGVDMSGAMLRGTIFSEADLRGANLRGAYMTDANLIKANLSGSDLSGANLKEADLTEANLYDTILREVNLHEALLLDANLTMAFLYKANLSESILRSAYIDAADLTEADLRGANISGANLRMTDLSRANLSYLKGWTIDQLDQVYKSKMDGVIMPDGEMLIGWGNPDGLTYEDWKTKFRAKKSEENLMQ